MKYEDAATKYAEEYGIVRYAVVENTMIYQESFLMERTSYTVNVNLDTMQEVRTKRESVGIIPAHMATHSDVTSGY